MVQEVHEINVVMLEAAAQQNREVVTDCLKKGAQLDAVDDKGWSSLMWAAINQHIDLMQLLI